MTAPPLLISRVTSSFVGLSLIVRSATLSSPAVVASESLQSSVLVIATEVELETPSSILIDTRDPVFACTRPRRSTVLPANFW